MPEFAWYVSVGAVGTAVHYAVFLTITLRAPQPVPLWLVVAASTAGALLGALVNYLLNRRLTFRSARPHRSAAPRFAVVAAGSLALNALTVGGLSAAGLAPLAAQVGATALVLVSGYLLNRNWTFAWQR